MSKEKQCKKKSRQPEKYIARIGTGLYAEMEKHSNQEMPNRYPERIIHFAPDILGLMDCHSQFFVPTPENRTKLEDKIKKCSAWYYVHIIHHGHERS